MGLAYGVGVQPMLVQGSGASYVDDGPTQPASSITIDGTPLRLALMGIGAGVGLLALRWGGFRFNVGVST